MPKGKPATLSLYADENTVLLWDDGAANQYALRFIRDLYPDNPRESGSDSSITSIWCRHPRYALGDFDRTVTACDWIACQLNRIPVHDLAMAIAGDSDTGCCTDAEIVDDLLMSIEDDAMEGRFPYHALDVMRECAVIMPLWLYDHSGLCIYGATAPMTEAWDTGRVGYACVTKQDVFRVCPDANDETWRYEGERKIYDELTVYNSYINGEAWRMTIYSKPLGCGKQDVKSMETWDEYDTLGTYYGSDLRANGMLADAPGLTQAIDEGRYDTGRLRAQHSIKYEFLRSA